MFIVSFFYKACEQPAFPAVRKQVYVLSIFYKTGRIPGIFPSFRTSRPFRPEIPKANATFPRERDFYASSP